MCRVKNWTRALHFEVLGCMLPVVPETRMEIAARELIRE